MRSNFLRLACSVGALSALSIVASFIFATHSSASVDSVQGGASVVNLGSQCADDQSHPNSILGSLIDTNSTESKYVSFAVPDDFSEIGADNRYCTYRKIGRVRICTTTCVVDSAGNISRTCRRSCGEWKALYVCR